MHDKNDPHAKARAASAREDLTDLGYAARTGIVTAESSKGGVTAEFVIGVRLDGKDESDERVSIFVDWLEQQFTSAMRQANVVVGVKLATAKMEQAIGKALASGKQS